MIDLAAIRERAVRAENAAKETDAYVMAQRWHSSASDVPYLLEIIDAVTPLVRASRNLVQGDYDKDALEALVEASDTLQWSVLDALGIVEDEDLD